MDMLGLRNLANKMSPIGKTYCIRKKEEESSPARYKKESKYLLKIAGRSLIDMREAFEHISYRQPPDFKLDTVARFLFGEEYGKLEEGGPADWHTNIERFIGYLYRDIEILAKMDKQFSFIHSHFMNLQQIIPLPVEFLYQQTKMIDMFLLTRYKDKCVFPTRRFNVGESFTGALVFEPEKGLHKNVVVYDFASLYPTIYMTFNISPETIDPNGEIKIGETRFTTKKRGMIPAVLNELLAERKKLQIKRDILEKQFSRNSTEWKVAEDVQGVFKALINSFYGGMAYPSFRLYSPQVASAITFIARELLSYTKDFIEHECGMPVLYGDSVSGRTCIAIKYKNSIRILRIDELKRHFEFNELKGIDFKRRFVPVKNIYTLSYNFKAKKVEWKLLKQLIEHASNKNIYSISTPKFNAEVTEDHSLFDSSGNTFSIAKYKNKQLCKKTRVFPQTAVAKNISFTNKVKVLDIYKVCRDNISKSIHSGTKDKSVFVDKQNVVITYKYCNNDTNRFLGRVNKIYKQYSFPRYIKLDNKLAFILGMFIAEGSTTYNGRNGGRISCSDIKTMKRVYYDMLSIFGKNAGINVNFSKDYVLLQFNNIVLSTLFSQLCGRGSSYKHLPDFILDTNKSFFLNLLSGYEYGDGVPETRCEPEKLENIGAVGTKSRKLVSQIYFIMRSCFDVDDNNIRIMYRPVKDTFSLLWIPQYRKNRKLSHKAVFRKERINTDKIYDISVTDNNNFIDCFGGIVLHNTDSLMVKFPDTQNKEEFESAAKLLGQRINNNIINFAKLYAPEEYLLSNGCRLDIKLEKLYQSFYIRTKKRYIGLYLDSDDYYVRGLELVRRDTPFILKKILRDLFLKVLKNELSPKDLDVAMQLLKSAPIRDIAISKMIAKEFDDYLVASQHIRAANFSKEYLGEEIYKADRPGMLFVKVTDKSKPQTDVCMIKEKTSIPEWLVIDYDRLFKSFVIDKLQQFDEIECVKKLLYRYTKKSTLLEDFMKREAVVNACQ